MENNKKKQRTVIIGVASAIILIALISLFMFNPKNKTVTSSSSNAKVLKVSHVTDGNPVFDGSYHESIWNGIKRAADDKNNNIEATYFEPKGDAEVKSTLESVASKKRDLIISPGAAVGSYVQDVAKNYPDCKFVLISSVEPVNEADLLPNVQKMRPYMHNASYLAGYAAGKKTQTNKVGVILGMDLPVINEFAYGFMAGAKSANPNVKFSVVIANTFSDMQKYSAISKQMITGGCDAIFSICGPCVSAVFTEVKNCKDRKVYSFGVDSNQNYMAPDNILGSAVIRLDKMTESLCKNLANGQFDGGKLSVHDIHTGDTDFEINEKLIDPQLAQQLQAEKQKLISGETVVPKTKAEYEKKFAH